MLVDFLEHGCTVYSNRYCTIPKSLQEATRRKHPSLLWNGVILLHANTRLHMADSKLTVEDRLGNRPSPTQPGFGTQWFSSVSYLEKALVRTLFHLWQKHQMCYHQVVNITGSSIFTSRMNKLFPRCDKCLNCQQDYTEKQCTSDTYILYCQFSPIKCCLLFMGNVNFMSDPLNTHKTMRTPERVWIITWTVP
jgi:hypothetical protein